MSDPVNSDPSKGLGLGAPLFDDNPASVDLLGYTAIAEAIAETVLRSGLDPVAIGVNAMWGGGKSTVLKLTAEKLREHSDVIVVEVDPWEFVDSGDPRGTLIARVIEGMSARLAEVSSQTENKTVQTQIAKARTKLNEMRKRVVWSKVASVAITSAVTLTPDIAGMVRALIPEPPENGEAPSDGSAGMSGFRDDFTEMLRDLTSVRRVIVLVDDLDRCLPPEILGALEAIKLFLSVEGMAFVIAADDDVIRAGVEGELGQAGADFAKRYTEKIIQLPFSLPRLSRDVAQAYIALLLTGARDDCTDSALMKIAAAASDRRASSNAPFVVPDEALPFPSSEDLTRAETIALGLRADQWSSPRAVKRFLNNFAIRAQIAKSWRIHIPVDVLLKLWIMEHRHSDQFREMASLADSERLDLLRKLEAEDSEAEPLLRAWAAHGPKLSERSDDVTKYITLAGAVTSSLVAGGALTQPEGEVLNALLDETDSVRRAAIMAFSKQTELRHANILVELASRVTSPAQKSSALDSLQRLMPSYPVHRDDVLAVLLDPLILASFDEADVPSLSGFPEVLEAIVEATPSENLRAVAADELREL